MIGNPTRDRAHDVERIERRHARPHLAQLASDARIRQIQPLGGGADRESQQQTFRAGAIGLRHKRRVDVASHSIRQQRIFPHPFRKHALRQSRTKTTRKDRRGACGVRRRSGHARSDAGSQSSVSRRYRSTSRASSSGTGQWRPSAGAPRPRAPPRDSTAAPSRRKRLAIHPRGFVRPVRDASIPARAIEKWAKFRGHASVRRAATPAPTARSSIRSVFPRQAVSRRRPAAAPSTG